MGNAAHSGFRLGNFLYTYEKGPGCVFARPGSFHEIVYCIYSAAAMDNHEFQQIEKREFCFNIISKPGGDRHSGFSFYKCSNSG